MRVFIVNPAFGEGFVKSARWFAKSRGRVQRHPDYLARATAVLEQAGHECVLLDAAAKDMPMGEVEERIRAFRPDLVVVFATTPSILSDLEHAKMAREATGGALTVMVGSHVSAEPADTLKRGRGFLDAVARREYDYTLREVADRGTSEGVAGISRWGDGEIVHEVDRAPIEDLDQLPFPAWQHIDLEDYHDAGKLFPFITLIGGRGCPAKCTFCQLPQVMYGHRYRTHSPGRILDEIEHDLELFPNLKEVMFEDDTLTLSTHLERLREICQGILDRGLNRRISWSCNARPDLTDRETLRLMKESGARMFCVGFEFGNDEMLRRIKKGIGTEKMREFAHAASDEGIRIHGCFMVGGPGETRETAMQTIRFAQELEIDTCQFTGVAAYPGTSYYEWARRNGYVVVEDWSDWVDENHEQRGVVDVPGLSMREIEELVDLGLKSFYLRPKQVKTIARNIRSLSDVRTKLHGLKSFVDYFGKPKSSSGGKKRTLKILFVDTPPTLDWSPKSNFTKGGRRFPALSVTGEMTYSYLNLQAAAVLREAGHEVAYIDCQPAGVSFAELVPKVLGHAPDLVVMYVEQIKMHVDLALAEALRERRGIRVGFVGPFVTPLGAKVLEGTAAVDFALRGEYDESLLEVADRLAAEDASWREVEGISVRGEDGTVVDVGSYRHVKDLDTLPLPAYDLVDLGRYHESVFRRAPAATMITSRGCPYQCVYCWFPQTIYGHKWRAQSAERVVAEMEHLHREFGVREIRLDDDIFELNRARVMKICELLREKKLDLTWAPQCRPDRMDPELLVEMKKAGCSRILYGCESASQEILDKMRKNGKVEDIANATRWTKDAGIDVHNCFIIGFPWDTRETVEKTIEYAYRLNAEFCQFGIATPLPGTQLLDIVEKEGSLVSKDDWSQHDGFSKSAVSYDRGTNGGLSQDAIERYATEAYRRYYVRPQYVGMMVLRAFRSRDDLAQTFRLGKAFLRRKALGWI